MGIRDLPARARTTDLGPVEYRISSPNARIDESSNTVATTPALACPLNAPAMAQKGSTESCRFSMLITQRTHQSRWPVPFPATPVLFQGQRVGRCLPCLIIGPAESELAVVRAFRACLNSRHLTMPPPAPLNILVGISVADPVFASFLLPCSCRRAS